ncbi:MAG: TetR family transcriptional regulator [Nevskia sp.]|nr:TetR family transcriptional regulator [Nevskia sp.]
MDANAFPKLLERMQELTPRQREQLRNVLAANPVAANASTPAAAPGECPHCGVEHPARHGRVRGQQRWRCGACKRTFSAATGTALNGIHRKSAWTSFTQAMHEGLSLSRAAERCGIHRDTASRWRRRVLDLPTRSRPAAVRQQASQGGDVMTDARTLRTRRSLHRALVSLLARKQFDQITVRDIAAAAGIGYATFFRHHASKADLLNEVAAEQVGRVMAMLMPAVEGADPRSASLLLCQCVSQQRAVWTSLLTGGAAGALRQEFVRLAQEHSRVRISDWLPVDLGAAHGVSATVEILAWWLRNPERQTAEQVAQLLDRLVVLPLLAGSFLRNRGGTRPAQG